MGFGMLWVVGGCGGSCGRVWRLYRVKSSSDCLKCFLKLVRLIISNKNILIIKINFEVPRQRLKKYFG